MKLAPKRFRQSIVKLSYGMSAKMENVLSLSTSCLNNERCLARSKNMSSIKALREEAIKGTKVSICRACFAVKTIKARTSVNANMVYNANVLQCRELSYSEVLTIASEIKAALEKNGTDQFRIESFGDIANETQARNYIRLCAMLADICPWINIAWWTKNSDILLNAWQSIENHKIRESAAKCLTILVSSVFVGIDAPVKEIEKVREVTKTRVLNFTVHFEDNGNINCGARSCARCRRCYDRAIEVPGNVVNELIK